MAGGGSSWSWREVASHPLSWGQIFLFITLGAYFIFLSNFQGRRNLVVAANGSTKVFSKSGKQVKSFPSNLPGGNRNQSKGRSSKYTILDCIYSESNSIFYILDMMCWDGFQYYDCDTEFRLSWVQQKFIEYQDLRIRSRINPYSFQPLPVYQCTKDSISAALNSPMPFSDHLDGILIYHREVRNIKA